MKEIAPPMGERDVQKRRGSGTGSGPRPGETRNVINDNVRREGKKKGKNSLRGFEKSAREWLNRN